MKKEIVKRALSGFQIGITIGYCFNILNSLIYGNGSYIPCTTALQNLMGSEIMAVVVQTILFGIVGASFAGSSVVWAIDSWSLFRQTGLYFLINSVVFIVVACISDWVDPAPLSIVMYFVRFVIIFFIVWAIQYFIWKRKVDKINHKISEKSKD